MLLLCLWVGLATVPATANARSRSTEVEVERMAADALNAYKGADYHRAVELLTRAYEIRQVPALLYNLGKAYDKLGDEEHAADAYRRYTQSSGAEPKLKARAEARLVVLDEARRKQVAAKAAAAAAAAPPPPPPPAPVVAKPQPPPEPVVPPELLAEQRREEARQAEQHRRHRDRVLALSFGAATVAFGSTALGLSINAVQLRNQDVASLDFERKRQLKSDALLQAGFADGLYAATVAAAVVTIIFFYRGFHHASQDDSDPALSFAPSLTSSSLGLFMNGRF